MVARLRLAGLGLRPRVLAALLLTSAVTLGAAAIALLGPLENRLRSDATNSLITNAVGDRHSYADALTARKTLDLTEVGVLSRALARRVGARVAFIGSAGQRVFDTDPDIVDPFDDVARALATGHTVHDVRFGRLRAAVPVRIHGVLYALALRKRLNEVAAANRVVSNAFLTAAAVGLVIALLLGVGLSRTMLLRLERLRDATRQMEAEGLHAPSPIDHSGDEIGQLARTFASMQSRLRRQEAARRAFVATASHELRTPLASLDGMLELLGDDLDEPMDIDDARQRLARAREQSRRLSQLASDLLDLSRIDAAVELRSEPVELSELSRAVMAEFERRASEKGCRLELHLGEQAWAVGDPGSLARIVRILLDNALRVSPSGAPVALSVENDAGSVRLTVADRGPGVPATDHDLIFERFQRGSTASGDGFGLGLAIGRELAQRMHGTLELRPSPAGARFTLTVPGDPTATPDPSRTSDGERPGRGPGPPGAPSAPSDGGAAVPEAR